MEMLLTSGYQIGILGRHLGSDELLKSTIGSRLIDLGADANLVTFYSESEIGRRNRKLPFIGIFFGYEGANNAAHPILKELIDDSVVIVPCVKDVNLYKKLTPELLSGINGFELSLTDDRFEKLCSVIFENFRLLRPDRRLFISYRRKESQNIAFQLYDALDAIGFDVFLDTRGVRPAADFQEVLWHRLADSDVVVLLDTPNFRESEWTRLELAQSNATNIQIVHILWPDVLPDHASAFSEFSALDARDFLGSDHVGENARLSPDAVNRICIAAESLRSRAMAARYRFLIDDFCDKARVSGKKFEIQAGRFISVAISTDRKIAVVPAVGIPNATRYQEIERAVKNASEQFQKVWLLYDERGILPTWLEHVDWLNQYLPIVAIKASASRSCIDGEG